MGPVSVVVGGIALQDGLEMAAPEDEGAIQALTAQRSHEPFRERVRSRCPDRGADDLDAFGGEHLVDAACVFRVAVPDEETEGERLPVDNEIARLLGHPEVVGIEGDPGEVHATGLDLDEEQNEEASEEHGIDGDESRRRGSPRPGLTRTPSSSNPPASVRDRYPPAAKISHTLLGATLIPRCFSSPWMRR